MAAWKFVVLGFVFSMLGYVHLQSNAIDIQSYQRSLTDIYQLAEKENLAIHEWQVRMRDERKETIHNKEEFAQLVDSWTKQLHDWKKTDVSLHGNEWVAQFTYHNVALQTTESVQLFAYLSPGQDDYTYLMTYDVIGLMTSELEFNKMYDMLDERTRLLGLNSADVYVQIQAAHQPVVTKQISNIEYAEKWIKALGAKTVEALDEETFVSVSAYNPAWSPVLKTKENKMNVQVALRQEERLGGRTTVTIGTPIITTEY